LNRFFDQISQDYSDGLIYYEGNQVGPDRYGTWRKNHPANDRLLRLSIAAGADVTPLIHFWGIHPENQSDLADSIALAGLPPSQRIYDALEHYKTIVPKSLEECQTHAQLMYPGGVPGSGNSTLIKAEHGFCNETWGPVLGQMCVDQIQMIQDLYFPAGRPAVDSSLQPNCALYANFTSSADSASAGQSIQFFDASIGIADTWVWSFPGATPSSSTDQNPIIAFDSIGLYTVTLTITDSVGTRSSTTRTSYINITIGEEELDNDLANTSIYPVPADDHLIIAFSKKPESAVQLSISDLSGKSIKSASLTDQSTTVDVSNIQAGMYIIKLSTDEGETTRKIIIE
jgi:hypothetical protein